MQTLTTMRTFLLLLLVIPALSIQAIAQRKIKKTAQSAEIRIPMDATSWVFDSSRVEFVKHRSVMAAKPKKGSYEIILKNHNFSSGTIEYDIELTGQGFPGIFFRMSEDKLHAENFYIRAFGEVPPEIRYTLQYAALMDGISIWDLADEYQSGAKLNTTGWNHVKLEILGNQMKVYVNDTSKPAMVIQELEAKRRDGRIMLNGNAIYANVIIKPQAVEEVFMDPSFSAMYNDTRYIRNWKVSPSKDFPYGREVSMPLPGRYGKNQTSDIPDSTTEWTDISANNRGIVNLTEKFGRAKGEQRRITWLKTSIESDKDQERLLHFGFSDEAWLFVNGQILYVDKNFFGTPNQKLPSGRCAIENATMKLPLKKGKNEIMIGVANFFYGWGIIARLDNTEGIRFTSAP